MFELAKIISLNWKINLDFKLIKNYAINNLSRPTIMCGQLIQIYHTISKDYEISKLMYLKIF